MCVLRSRCIGNTNLIDLKCHVLDFLRERQRHDLQLLHSLNTSFSWYDGSGYIGRGLRKIVTVDEFQFCFITDN